MSPSMQRRKARVASRSFSPGGGPRPRANTVHRLSVALLCALLFLSCGCGGPGEAGGPESTAISVPSELKTTAPYDATGGTDAGETGSGGYEITGEGSRIEGMVQDAEGNPMEGVQVTFYPQPRRYGVFYETYTDYNGAYAVILPEGIYQTFAFYGDPDDGQLTPDGTGYGSSFSVPPDKEIDFLWEPYL